MMGVRVGVVLALVAAACVGVAQGARQIIVTDEGVVRIKDADGTAAQIEINCHGPDWTLASQSDGTAQIKRIDDTLTLITGQMPVAAAKGGVVTYELRIREREGSTALEYSLGFSGPIAIHNLQVSMLLPVERYAGTRLLVTYGQTGRRRVLLPRGHNAAMWVLGSYEANGVILCPIDSERIECSAAEGKTRTLEIYDLQRWERDEFEVRAPLIAEQNGKLVGKDHRFDLTLKLPGDYELRLP